MSSRTRFLARRWALPILLGPAVLVRCSGTEADNPVTDVVVTACKSQPEYDPEQVGDFLRQVNASQTASSRAGEVFKRIAPPSTAIRPPLTATSEIPIGLSCLEWQRSENALQVQLVNFQSGCGAEWEGQATRAGERVTLTLENRICAVAACGNCLYDTASVIDVPPSQGDVTVELSLDPFCDGNPRLREWQLPLSQTPRGISCEFAAPQGLGSVRGAAFLWCAEEGDACDAGLTCVPGAEPFPRCLPACSVDADCPLAGGTRCEAGHCVPSAS